MSLSRLPHERMLFYDLHPAVTAFSTERHCSAAKAPYDGFNITPYTGDDAAHVEGCKQLLCDLLHIDDRHLVVPHQIHGTQIAEITTENLGSSLEGIDAVVTQLPDTCIGVSTADCVPIVIYDGRNRAIAAIHAGWRGTVARIASKTLTFMSERYGTRPEDVKAAIGPSIGPDAFEVGDEVVDAFANAGYDIASLAFRNSRWHINLWEANATDLKSAGLDAKSIDIAGLCTFANPTRFFSARRLGINSGRMFTGCLIADSCTINAELQKQL